MGIYNNFSRLPRVVVIGGGTGLAVMLRGLKQKALDITAIVTVADDGGSSGILREELRIPPPGDVRSVLSALAVTEPLMYEVLKYRFSSGTGLVGHSLGNLILASLIDITGDFVTGVEALSRILAIKGRVLPVANQAVVLKAEMEDGSIVIGESAITKSELRIRRVFLEPKEIKVLPEALHALSEADAIIIGPGSLYTSIMPNLIMPKFTDALLSSDAVKIFICNVMTQPGETDNYTVSDHLTAIQMHVNHPVFDFVIANNGVIPKEVQTLYTKKGSEAVELDIDNVTGQGYQVIADEFVQFRTYLRHDAFKLSEQIYRLVNEWMTGKKE